MRSVLPSTSNIQRCVRLYPLTQQATCRLSTAQSVASDGLAGDFGSPVREEVSILYAFTTITYALIASSLLHSAHSTSRRGQNEWVIYS